MKYKKFFSLLFISTVFSLSILTVIFMIVSNDTFSKSFPLREPLLNFKTMFLDIVGVEEFNDVYRADDRFVKVAGPANEIITKENQDIITEVSRLTNTPIYFSLVPTAEYVEQANLNRRSLVWDQGEYIDNIYYNVIENVNIIDITDTLLNCNDNNIYFKTTDRISPRGGYYIFQTVMRKFGRQVEDIQEYDIEYFTNTYKGELSDVFVGTDISDTISFYRYPLFRRNLIMNITDEDGKTTTYQDVYLKEKNGLDAYMGGENPITIIGNDETLSNKLLVLTDNTFNVSSGFFIDYFDEITIINPMTSFKNFEKINMEKYDSVLMLFSTNTFNSKSIKNLLNMVE